MGFKNTAIQGILDLWTWAASYVAAQVFYEMAAATVAYRVDMSYSAFASVDENGVITMLIPRDKTAPGYAIVFVFNMLLISSTNG